MSGVGIGDTDIFMGGLVGSGVGFLVGVGLVGVLTGGVGDSVAGLSIGSVGKSTVGLGDGVPGKVIVGDEGIFVADSVGDNVSEGVGVKVWVGVSVKGAGEGREDIGGSVGVMVVSCFFKLQPLKSIANKIHGIKNFLEFFII